MFYISFMSKDVQTKLLLNSIREADGGAVEYVVQTQTGEKVRGVIEDAFFQEFKVTNQSMTGQRKERIAVENADYIEEMANRQIRIGLGEVIIK